MNISKLKSRIRYYIGWNPKKALGDLDDIIAKHVDKRNGVFIEVGANNGLTQSNTYFLEVKKKWTGVLIEPNNILFKECEWNRPNSEVYNCALVSDDFEDEFVTLHDANLMSITGNDIDEDQLAHLERGIEIQNMDKVRQYKVPARTLTAVLDDSNVVSEIDLFSLDVEGNELSVLKGLDFKKYKPKMILVETKLIEEISDLLCAKGYNEPIKVTHHDYIFKVSD